MISNADHRLYFLFYFACDRHSGTSQNLATSKYPPCSIFHRGVMRYRSFRIRVNVLFFSFMMRLTAAAGSCETGAPIPVSPSPVRNRFASGRLIGFYASVHGRCLLKLMVLCGSCGGRWAVLALMIMQQLGRWRNQPVLVVAQTCLGISVASDRAA